jgi:hypothetical protein
LKAMQGMPKLFGKSDRACDARMSAPLCEAFTIGPGTTNGIKNLTVVTYQTAETAQRVAYQFEADFIRASEAISAVVWSFVDIQGTGSKCFNMQPQSVYDFLRPRLDWPICSQSPSSRGLRRCGSALTTLRGKYEEFREGAA